MHCDGRHSAARPAQGRHLLFAERRRVYSRRRFKLFNRLRKDRESVSLRVFDVPVQIYTCAHTTYLRGYDGHELLERRVPTPHPIPSTYEKCQHYRFIIIGCQFFNYGYAHWGSQAARCGINNAGYDLYKSAVIQKSRRMSTKLFAMPVIIEWRMLS